MTKNMRFHSTFCVTAFLLAICLAEACHAQPAPPQNQEEEYKFIYPKHKDIVIEQSDEDKKNTKEKIVTEYPLGKTPYYLYEGIEGDYYRIKEPIPGRLKKVDCYSFKEFKALDAQKILISKDNWMKFVVAVDYFLTGYDQEGVDMINTIEPEFRNNTEIRILRARLSMQFKAFDSALLDVEPIVNAKAGPGNSRPANVRLIKATALLGLEKYQEVLDELDISLNELNTTVPEWFFIYWKCHYKLGNYEKVLKDFNLNKNEFTSRVFSYLEWLKLRCLVLKDQPEYDKAIDRLDTEEILKSECGRQASLDAAIIYSTRPDLAKRNGKRALEMIEPLKKGEFYDCFVKDVTMAETLAHLELGNYLEASRCMEALKAMYTTEEEFPYLKQVEKAIRLKQKFVPKGRMPLVREKYL